MSATARCSKCGAPVSDEVAGGFCAACLLEEGLAPAEVKEAPLTLKDFGDYELIEEIARGGMGVVFKARQRSLNRIVALKMILSGHLASEAEAQRFRAEARAAAALQHPGIVAIHEVGEHEGLLFFSMDYVEGQSFAQLVRDGPLPAPRAAESVREIAEAIHYAHEHGVLHRDLKPSNVLLDSNGKSHVMDFGLARSIESDTKLTLTGQILGTPGYMSPEQAEGRSAAFGPPTDVYSLGAMLYELLTGRPPFAAATPHETLNQVLNSEPVAPQLLNPSVPRDLETICLKCLEKEPERRYGSAQALALDLGRHLNHEPILAVPPSTVYRARKFVRRHRTGVMFATVVGVLLLLAATVSIDYGLRAERERRAADKSRQEESTQRTLAIKAESEAKTQARAAVDSAAEATAILNFFLENILIAGSPEGEEGGLGRNATLREAVAAAEAKISETFGTRPLLEAQIRGVLGDTYHRLGETTAALAQHQRAYEILKVSVGENDERRLAVWSNVAFDMSALGRVKDAQHIYQEVLTRSTERMGETNHHTIRAMNNLAEADLTLHRYEEALPLLQRAAELERRYMPTDKFRNQLLAAILGNLGNCQMSLRQFLLAAASYEEALALLQAQGLEGSNQGWTLRGNLAMAWRALGRREEARKSIEDFAREVVARLGPKNPASLRANGALATSYVEDGLLTNALQLYTQTVKAYETNLGLQHYETLTAMNNLAMTQRYLRLTNEALMGFERVVALREEHHPDEIHDLAHVKINLATVYREAGRTNEALALLESARDQVTNHLSPNAPATLHVLNTLATFYCASGKVDEGIRLHEETLQRREAVYGSYDKEVCDSCWNLSSAYRAAERTEDSVRMLYRLLACQTGRLGATNAQIRLANACLDAGFIPEGANVLRVTLQDDALVAKQNAYALAQASQAVGTRLLEQKKFAEAEPFLRQTREIYEIHQAGLSPAFEAQCRLGQALVGQQQFAAAAPLLIQGVRGLARRQETNPTFQRQTLLSEFAATLVQLYEAWGQPEKADLWRRRIQNGELTSEP